jgi:hypothetical protein
LQFETLSHLVIKTPPGLLRPVAIRQRGWFDMNADTLMRTPGSTPERRWVLALEAEIAELRSALDYTIHDVQTAAGCAVCDAELESVPHRGRGRPPKFTPVQLQLLALEAQFAKLRAELDETLSIIKVQQRDFTRCRGCPSASRTPGGARADTPRRTH